MTIMDIPFKRPIRVANYNPADDAVLVDADGKEILGVSEWLRCDDTALDFVVAAVNAHDQAREEIERLQLDVQFFGDTAGSPDRRWRVYQALNCGSSRDGNLHEGYGSTIGAALAACRSAMGNAYVGWGTPDA